MTTKNSTDTSVPSSAASSWWQTTLTRRSLHQWTALSLAAVGAASLVGCDSCSDDDEIVEQDTTDVQKNAGWNVGAEEMPLPLRDTSSEDSLKSTAFSAYKNDVALLEATKPTQSKWQPYERPTLVQSLSQESLANTMQPVFNHDMLEAYQRGPALSSLIDATDDASSTLLVVDMDGPKAVALAASLADKIDPAFAFDNIPHPQGVVPSQQTLGALLYYAGELRQKSQKRAEATSSNKALPLALITDSHRLTPYTDDSDLFDNRYLAYLPSADELSKLGIKRVLYVSDQSRTTEADDLNDTLVSYDEAKIPVQMLALDAFTRDPDYDRALSAGEKPKDTTTNGYYYGGSYHSHTYFYSHYPMFVYVPRPSYYVWASAPIAPTMVSAPSYRPAARPTMFSSRVVGGASGVGRMKPTGFGRVTTRVNRSSGSITGAAPRSRSGSLGRSRSFSFGG